MDKNAIKKFAVQARVDLLERVSQKALQYGIEKNVTADASVDNVNGFVLSDEEKAQRKALIRKIEAKGYDEVMEEVAYTWFNRFIALRFMEVNNYLPSRVRVFTDEANNLNPQILEEAIHLDLPGLDMDKVFDFKERNLKEELYQYLLMTQCYALYDILPIMFPQYHSGDYTMLLMPDHLLREGSVIDKMLKETNEADWRDAVQIIGWMFQYYISDKHDAIININKGTVSQEDVPAATQLFTTDWVVKYMVDNSLGRYWIERNPNSHLADKLEFFVKPKDGKIHYVSETITPQDVTFFDPCMGSGHILAYAFDVLMEIYREYGYTDREAVSEILQHNLHGFDIDERCTQLAYFVIMMKARKYDSRFFRRHVYPQLYYPQSTSDLQAYGSLLQVDELEERPEEPEEITFFNENYGVLLNDWNCRRLLAQKYAVVCTNPPYLNKYNNILKDFVLEYYKDYSGDLFSVFMYRNFGLCKPNGYSAFMTPFVWMFIRTYEKLREFILQSKEIATLVQMEYSAFEEATVPVCCFVLRNSPSEQNGLYFKLSEFKGGMNVQKDKVLEAISSPSCSYYFENSQKYMKMIPGTPIAFWLNETAVSPYRESERMSKYITPMIGMVTGDTNRFLRYWQEVDISNIGFGCRSESESQETQKKWFPYQKGGGYRRWYGNNEYVVNWENSGYEIKYDNFVGKRVRSHNYNGLQSFVGAITWSSITSSKFSARIVDDGFLYDVAGPFCQVHEKYRKAILAFIISKVATLYLDAINPTINFVPGTLLALPLSKYIIQGKSLQIITECAEKCISLEIEDWDSFETSWDFKRHPLV